MSLILNGEVSILGQLTLSISPVTYRFFRLNITGFQTGSIVKISDFRLYQSGTYYPAVDMTGSSSPSPLVASASSDGGGGLEAWNAFDDNLPSGTWWRNDGAGPPDWLKIDLGVGNELKPTKFKIANGNNAGQSPSDFTLEASNDDSSWVILATLAGVTWSGTQSTKEYFITY